MDDLIYREAAVKALGRYHDETLKRVKDTDERSAQTLAITNCMGIINHTVETAHHDRTEENDRLNKWFLGQNGKTFSSYDEAMIGNLGVIASILMDISKSLAIIADKEKQDEEIDLVVRQLREEAEYAYADFDEYKAETLGADADELPDDDFRYGLERAIEIIRAVWKEQK